MRIRGDGVDESWQIVGLDLYINASSNNNIRLGWRLMRDNQFLPRLAPPEKNQRSTVDHESESSIRGEEEKSKIFFFLPSSEFKMDKIGRVHLPGGFLVRSRGEWSEKGCTSIIFGGFVLPPPFLFLQLSDSFPRSSPRRGGPMFSNEDKFLLLPGAFSQGGENSLSISTTRHLSGR